jgi:hypothetical protein
MKGKVFVIVLSFLLLSVPNVMAQLPCTADFDCTQTVDANDVTEFLNQFGRSPFNDPCPDCYDSPCPCSATSSCIEKIPRTGETTSDATGDDGNLQKGIAWPTPRFADNGDGTVTDNLTGLIWITDANCYGQTNWYTALSLSNALASGSCGLTDGSSAGDWRLPNMNEQLSLIHWAVYDPGIPDTAGTGKWSVGDPFTNIVSDNYWTSTTNPSATQRARTVRLYDGTIAGAHKTDTVRYFWPVRDTLDRFTDNGDGTVTDNDTGLVWLKDANCYDGVMTWYDALDTANTLNSGECGLSDGSGVGDWRLATKEEWDAFICTQYTDPVLCDTLGKGQWSEGDPFTNLPPGQRHYWTSTDPGSDIFAYGLRLDLGTFHLVHKSNYQYHIWPVRDPL